MKTLIVIPARYASTRLPGKPLRHIGNKEMIVRVYENALKASQSFPNTEVLVATEDSRIVGFCQERNIPIVLTSEDCSSGTDRVFQACQQMDKKPDFVVNLQGDNPACPPWFIESLLGAYNKNPQSEILTPVVHLKWNELDELRENKKDSPFSGTTAVFGADGNAFYFSKNIIPAIRKEDKFRQVDEYSPVFRHVGLYAYRYDILERVIQMKKGVYEVLEGLEQLRWIENGIKVKCVPVSYREFPKLSALSGVDTEEDLKRVESVLAEYNLL